MIIAPSSEAYVPERTLSKILWSPRPMPLLFVPFPAAFTAKLRVYGSMVTSASVRLRARRGSGTRELYRRWYIMHVWVRYQLAAQYSSHYVV